MRRMCVLVGGGVWEVNVPLPRGDGRSPYRATAEVKARWFRA
jgi:hypothetical protein